MPAHLPACLFTCLQQLPEDAPVLVLLPGLTGGSEDSYVQHAVVSLGSGWRCRCMWRWGWRCQCAAVPVLPLYCPCLLP